MTATPSTSEKMNNQPYVVALSPIDGEPVRFDTSKTSDNVIQALMKEGWSILPDASEYEEELAIWERKMSMGF